MSDTSNATNAKNAGRRRRPFEIATLLIPCRGGRARVMDASDEEFQSFIKGAGLPVDDQGIAEWSFDDRCGIINHAIKHGVQLPFIEEKDTGVYAPSGPLSKASQDAFSERAWEQKNSGPNKNNSSAELFTSPESAPQQGMIDIDDAPIISGWANIVKATLQSGSPDEHPLTPPMPAPTVRPFPDLEGEE
jgi:hypothetical protein